MNLNYTLFGQMVFFILFVVFCMKYVWPPVTRAMAERAAKIAEGLAAAERASKDLELAQEKATDEMRSAKESAAQIIEQARRRADQMIEESKEKAREEANRIKAAAEADAAQQVAQARESLRKQVAALAVAGAEKILESSVDAKAHAQMLDKLASQL